MQIVLTFLEIGNRARKQRVAIQQCRADSGYQGRGKVRNHALYTRKSRPTGQRNSDRNVRTQDCREAVNSGRSRSEGMK
jgi:hypothetical protein